jgi:tetratricopeptide (TPR) repeat protein
VLASGTGMLTERAPIAPSTGAVSHLIARSAALLSLDCAATFRLACPSVREQVSEEAPKREPEAERVRVREAVPDVRAPLTAESALGLQRRVGNRAVAVLARREGPRTLTRASFGNDIRELQLKLMQLSCVHTVTVPDNAYGQDTENAVKEFQRAHPPLKVTGQADPETQSAIDAALAEPQDKLVVGEKIFKLGGAMFEQGHFGQAYDHFTRAGELVPERPGVIFSRAQALRRMGGRRAKAIELYEQFIALAPDSKHAAEARAHVAEMKVSKSGDAKADEARAHAIFDKGGAYFEAGDYGHALDEFEKAGELTDRPGIIFSKAQALKRLGGRREEAIALYKQFLASGGGSHAEEARKALDELTAQSGESARAVFDEGGAAYQQGQYGQAADKFAVAHELDPSRPGIVFSEANALREQGGHRDEAIALYKLYLDMGGGSRTADAKFYLDTLTQLGAAY